MREFMAITKALSDESRVRLLMALAGGELCVCQLTELAGLSPSTVSKHMSILRQAGLVEGRKNGRWVHYRRAGEDASGLVPAALEWVRACIEKDPLVSGDARRLKKILKLDPEKLCRRQSAPLYSSHHGSSARDETASGKGATRRGRRPSSTNLERVGR